MDPKAAAAKRLKEIERVLKLKEENHKAYLQRHAEEMEALLQEKARLEAAKE